MMTNLEWIKNLSTEKMVGMIKDSIVCDWCIYGDEIDCGNRCKDDILVWLESERSETDEIFLLSVEEYEKYKDSIPYINMSWWLRSPGKYRYDAACVGHNGDVNRSGFFVNYYSSAIRPALRIPNLKVGERIVKYGCTWIGIDDDDLAIAEVPIGFEMFDEKDNDYETSYIREWLLDWMKERSI